MPEMFAVVLACLPAGCKPKWLRAVRGRETDKLVDATNQDGGDRATLETGSACTHTAQQAQPSAPQKLLRSDTGSLPDQARA